MPQLRSQPSRRSSEHGRYRYQRGCRCDECRAACARYESARRRGEIGQWVSTQGPRQHLVALGRCGIGYQIVADAARVHPMTAWRIRSGRTRRCRAEIAERLMGVDDACGSDWQLVPAARTWRALNALIEDGYARGQLALWLGRRAPDLDIGRTRVRRRTEWRVLRLAAKLEKGEISR